MSTLDSYLSKILDKHSNIVSDLIEVFRSKQSNSPQHSISLVQIRLAYLDKGDSDENGQVVED